jgi:predicted nucleic acid-binding protein
LKAFLDANILVSVLNKEYPSFIHTARVLSLSGYKKFILFSSPTCLAIAFYFAEKKYGAIEAKKRIAILINHISITNCGQNETIQAINNVKANDFEDALQYYSAFNAKCNCIITYDTTDYYYSKIEIIDPESFLKKYL